MEKALVTHSSTLAWKIPWREEPGRLQSMRLRRVGHNSATSLSLFTLILWRRKWQPTPASLPGESQGRGILVGCHAWGRTESDTTEVTQQQQEQQEKQRGRETEKHNWRGPRVDLFQVWREQGLHVITRLYLLHLFLRTGSIIRLNMNSFSRNHRPWV